MKTLIPSFEPLDLPKPGTIFRQCIGFKNNAWTYRYLLVIQSKKRFTVSEKDSAWFILTVVREDGSIGELMWNRYRVSDWIPFDPDIDPLIQLPDDFPNAR
jgi:hypothetical protein